MNKKTKLLNRQNNLMDQKISEENQEAFTNIICYLRGASISEYEIEVVRQDLTEMVLSAQSRGENIESIIGKDYQQFCDNIIESLPPKSTKKKIADTLDVICWGLSILFAINIIISEDTIDIIASIFNNAVIDWSIDVSAGMIAGSAFILGLAYIIVTSITKNAFYKDKKHGSWMTFTLGAGISLIFLVIAWLGRDVLFSVNILAAIAVTAALFIAHKILE